MSALTASFDLRPVARSVPAARHVVTELLTSWHAPHDLDDAALLVTELVTNVVDHVGGEAVLTVEVTLSDAWLRISVADGSAVRPVVRELDSANPRGRGLRLVQMLSAGWGADDHDGGKRVWFDLAAPAV